MTKVLYPGPNTLEAEMAKPASQFNRNSESDLWKMRLTNEVQGHIRELQGKLETVNKKLFDFRTAHCVFVGSQMFFACRTVTGRTALDREWPGLITERDRLLREWNAALAEFAALKT